MDASDATKVLDKVRDLEFIDIDQGRVSKIAFSVYFPNFIAITKLSDNFVIILGKPIVPGQVAYLYNYCGFDNSLIDPLGGIAIVLIQTWDPV